MDNYQFNNEYNTTDNNANASATPYVLWRRVSTQKQGDSGLGLEAQLTIAEYFMHSSPVKTFTDVYSGTKLDECPNLQRAMKYCKERGLLLVIAKTDRFRNVKQALDILDEMGDDNVRFCDLPTTDRTVLTIVFAVWERQALMGRINTQKALDERKKLAQKGETWISQSGKLCTKLGNPKGYNMAAANAASVVAKQDEMIRWRKNSQAVKFALRKQAEGLTVTQIAEELGYLYDENVHSEFNPYATPKGCKPSKGSVSRWLRDSNLLLQGGC